MGTLIHDILFVMFLLFLAWLTFTVVEFAVTRAINFVANGDS